MSPFHILIVEDDQPVRNLIITTLKMHGYAYSAASDAAQAIQMSVSEKPDLVLLDLGLPDLDGMEVIKSIRSWSLMPVIVVSARGEDTDKIHALDAGADDYLTKPFASGELLARVRALLRRSQSFTPDVIRFKDLSLDCTTYRLSCGRKQAVLSKKTFQLAEMFLRSPGVILSAEKMMEHIWGWDTEAEINVVWVNISTLRKALAEIGSEVRIRMVRGAGYVME